MKAKKFNKNCSKCNDLIFFSCKRSLKRSIKRNTFCAKCLSNWVGNYKICSICKKLKKKNKYYKNYYTR